jgi:hypothetical protein
MEHQGTLVPAYGRDYQDEEAAQIDWYRGKDFRLHSPMYPQGVYTSIRDWGAEDEFQLKFNKLEDVTVVYGSSPNSGAVDGLGVGYSGERWKLSYIPDRFDYERVEPGHYHTIRQVIGYYKTFEKAADASADHFGGEVLWYSEDFMDDASTSWDFWGEPETDDPEFDRVRYFIERVF